MRTSFLLDSVPQCDLLVSYNIGYDNPVTVLHVILTEHTARYCKNDDRKKCFKYGNVGHFRDRYPRLNKGSISTSKRNKEKRVTRENQRSKAQEGAFVIGTEEARQDPRVITGTFLINGHYASVIFDSGADRSFVSLGFRPLIPLASESLDEVYSIELADGQELKARDVLLNCTLSLADELFSIDLIPIELGSFDAVVGMDWLSQNRATIGCYERLLGYNFRMVEPW
ncbi:hypothetical protein OSB04_025960 [Centaurea solstitialis]|uniref:Reverse transcriptase domain-containing protein n=1 Tax=Centaurea solstitialis TaxID=347529 RepID=A0AA38SPM8_9ASTR|nr:hypothetical protein OSB04_025960 [Centaurea solstitialis]